MNKFRTCDAANLNTGQSKCQLDMRKVIGALIVPNGFKLPSTLDGETLEKLCHADPASRVRPLFDFVEYAPNGGEAQVSAVGYGPNEVTGYSARTDTFTTGKYSEHLAAAFTKSMNSKYDVYYVDEKFNIFGLNDGTDSLAGFPMSTIYHGGAPHPTSSAKATQTINFCHKDAQAAIEDFDYVNLGFDPRRFAIGLVTVKFVKVGESGNKWKLVEAQGGYDRTSEFGTIISTKAADVLNGSPEGVAYNADDETLTISGTPALKTPAELFEAGIKGIVAA